MNWLLLAGSLAAVLMLAAIAWALGLGRKPGFQTEADAMAAAADALPGFRPHCATLCRGGGAALVEGDGGVAILRAHGNHWAARLLPGASAHTNGDRLLIETREAMFGRVALDVGAERAAAVAARLNRDANGQAA